MDVGEHAGHGEAIHGLPEGDVIGDVIRICQWSDVERRMGRDHEPVGREVAIPGPYDGVEHGFVKQAIAHPFGYYDVDVRNGKRNLFDFASEAAVTEV